MTNDESKKPVKKTPVAGTLSKGKAPTRTTESPKRSPGQNIGNEKSRQREKDGGVDEDGRGRLTQKDE